MTQLNLLKPEMDSKLTYLADTSRGSCNMNDRESLLCECQCFRGKRMGWMAGGGINGYAKGKNIFIQYK